MKKNEFISIISNYNGEIQESDNKVVFTSKNDLKHCYSIKTSKGIHFITQLKKVVCTLVFDEINDKLEGTESSHEILGEFSALSPSREIVIENLEKYNFRKKGQKLVW